MQTRKQRGTRIAEDIHRALHMRATMTGTTIEDTLDALLRPRLRRELHLMAEVAKQTTLADVLEQLDRDGYYVVNDGAVDHDITDYLGTMDDEGPEVAAIEERDGTVHIHELDERGYQKSVPMLTARKVNGPQP